MNVDEIAEQVRMCAACPKMCRHVCPTFFAWRSDSPTPHGRALLIHYELNKVRPFDERAIEVIYQCLECSHCLTWCVPGIDIATIVETIRTQIVRNMRAPNGLKELASTIIKVHNPFGEPHELRNNWLQIGNADGPEIIYFTGCTSAYREKSILSGTIELLTLLDYQVSVSQEEWCCGSPLFRTGFTEMAISQARHNVDLLNAMNGEMIVVTCPGCYRTLTTDYPQYGFTLNKPIKHISELLANRLDDLVLGGLKGRATYHDPCHLGRHSGIYDDPRAVINRVMNGGLVEMERNRENAMCCGNGAGLRTLFPDKAKLIGYERINQAVRTGADFLVTACPFCKNMLSSQAENITVLDLPELVLRAQYNRNGHNPSTD